MTWLEILGAITTGIGSALREHRKRRVKWSQGQTHSPTHRMPVCWAPQPRTALESFLWSSCGLLFLWILVIADNTTKALELLALEKPLRCPKGEKLNTGDQPHARGWVGNQYITPLDPLRLFPSRVLGLNLISFSLCSCQILCVLTVLSPSESHVTRSCLPSSVTEVDLSLSIPPCKDFSGQSAGSVIY